VIERWPDVLLQWEDFAGSNAARLLARYRDRLCTFNDDIQGTAAVAAASLMAAINVTGVPLTEQRIALLGAGSAGCGIAALLLQGDDRSRRQRSRGARRFFAVDRYGLLVEGMPGHHAGAGAVRPEARGRCRAGRCRSRARSACFDVVPTPNRRC
jgi:malate dehydrogenase (oxaloacetate-decarboxylating)